MSRNILLDGKDSLGKRINKGEVLISVKESRNIMKVKLKEYGFVQDVMVFTTLS